MTRPVSRRRFLALALTFCPVGALLGACGQKGPLYLPEEDEDGDEDRERREESSHDAHPSNG